MYSPQSARGVQRAATSAVQGTPASKSPDTRVGPGAMTPQGPTLGSSDPGTTWAVAASCICKDEVTRYETLQPVLLFMGTSVFRARRLLRAIAAGAPPGAVSPAVPRRPHGSALPTPPHRRALPRAEAGGELDGLAERDPPRPHGQAEGPDRRDGDRDHREAGTTPNNARGASPAPMRSHVGVSGATTRYPARRAAATSSAARGDRTELRDDGTDHRQRRHARQLGRVDPRSCVSQR